VLLDDTGIMRFAAWRGLSDVIAALLKVTHPGRAKAAEAPERLRERSA
jgi:hypothetical protein